MCSLFELQFCFEFRISCDFLTCRIGNLVAGIGTVDDTKLCLFWQLGGIEQAVGTAVSMWSKPTVRRKTKIVCTIGPSTDTREMIWKLAEAGMNVARLNMSHGDHASHQKVIDLVKEYNAQSKDNSIAIMLDTKAGYLRSFRLQ